MALAREHSSNLIARLRRLFSWLIDDWRESQSRLDRWGRRCIGIAVAIAKDLAAGDLTLRAMSLVYTTLLSLVPFLAIVFSVLKGFGVHNQLEPMLLNVLAPLGDKSVEVAASIIGFVDKTQVGILGFAGFAVLGFTVLSLMQKVEGAFNFVWKVAQNRPLAQRIRDYISVLVVGPILIVLSLGMMASLVSTVVTDRFSDWATLGWVLEHAGRLLPFLTVVTAFTFVYLFVPNTRVKVGSAFAGALVAGLLWNLVGWAFTSFVASSPNYVAVYSGFATPIVLMIWLYLSWLILLLGASVAFYHQNPRATYLIARLKKKRGIRDDEKLALTVIAEIGRHFYATPSQQATADTLVDALDIDYETLDRIITELRRSRIITAGDDSTPAYLPACPWEQISVDELLRRFRTSSRSPQGSALPPKQPDWADQLLDRIDEGRAQATVGMFLSDLATRK